VLACDFRRIIAITIARKIAVTGTGTLDWQSKLAPIVLRVNIIASLALFGELNLKFVCPQDV